MDKIHCELGEMKLSPNDAKLQFLQRLRDEAHRFAISFHRKTRDKTNLAKSELAKLNPLSKLITLDSKTGEGFEAWIEFIAEQKALLKK